MSVTTTENDSSLDFDFSALDSVPPLVVTDAPCSFHRVNSGASTDGPFRVPISREAAQEAGRKLDKQDVVSLIFLLVTNVDNALLHCRSVEAGTYPKPVGPMFMVSLVETGRKNQLTKWDIKVACAMHLLRRYKQLQTLVGLSKSEAKTKFENREYLYLEHFRVGLFKLAYNLSASDSTSLLPRMVEELKPTDPSKIKSSACLETNLLEMMSQKILYPGEPIVKIANTLPRSKKIHLPIPCLDDKEKKLRNGYCIILSQKVFQKNTKNYDDRTGTDLDVKKLRETWERFDCTVEVLTEKTGAQLKAEFKRLSCRDYRDNGFLVVCLLSHGERIDNVDYIMGTDGVPVRIKKDITDLFVNAQCTQTLTDKLKLFIVQACRGQKGQVPVPVVTHDGLYQPKEKGGQRIHVVPSIGGYIIFNSTIADFASWRNIKEGSYFVQMLCTELNENGRYYDIDKLLRNTMRNVSESTGTQQPEITSTYGKEAYLYDKLEGAEVV